MIITPGGNGENGVGSRHLLQVPPVLELTSVYLALVIGEGGLLAPRTPQEALEIFRNPDANDWERDYAALMIDSLDEALPELEKVARDASASEMLQQRAAEVLGCAWRDRGILLTADITGFTPIARQEILFHRGEGLPYPD